MINARIGTHLAALSLSALATVSPAVSQEGGPGREGVLSYGVGVEYDFEDGPSTTTDVAVTLRTRTAIDELELRFGTELFGDFRDDGTDEFIFRNRFVEAEFARRLANSSLSLSVGYSEIDLEDEVDTSGPFIIISDEGELATTRAEFSIETGIEGPFGVSFDASYRDSDYTDADREDETEISADILARLALSQALDLRALAGISQIDEDDLEGTERETTYVGLGLGGTTAGNLSFTADLLYDRAEVTTTTPASTDIEEGLGFEVDITQERPDGSIGARVASRVDDAGRRTTAIVSRRYDTPTGDLSFSLGVVDAEDDDELRAVGSLGYSRSTGDGQAISATLARDAATDDGATTISTSLELTYAREIDQLSGWEAGLGYFETDEVGGEVDNRTTATLTYRREITPEWSMQTGYSYSREDDGEEDNSVFFNVTRDITFGF